MDTKQKDIATIHKVSPAFISRLLAGDKKTDRWELARDLAKYSGKPALFFINPRHSDIFKRAYPKIFTASRRLS